VCTVCGMCVYVFKKMVSEKCGEGESVWDVCVFVCLINFLATSDSGSFK
jgi:hypothetical protein